MRFSLIRSKLLLGFAFVVSIVLIQGWVEHRRSLRVEKVLDEAYRTAASESDAAEHMFSGATWLYFSLERLPERGSTGHPAHREGDGGTEKLRRRGFHRDAEG